MNENNATVTIPREEYNELMRTAERAAVLERILKCEDYVSTKDIMTILNIKKGE